MPPATLILHRKRRPDDGAISEMKLWVVPSPVRGSRHRFRYSLFYGRRGERLIGYDNEPGKGDHRHYGNREEPYHFTLAGTAGRGFSGRGACHAPPPMTRRRSLR
jgi:hypothetical protein